jgi:Recombinase zinc beta ribbon domain
MVIDPRQTVRAIRPPCKLNRQKARSYGSRLHDTWTTKGLCWAWRNTCGNCVSPRREAIRVGVRLPSADYSSTRFVRVNCIFGRSRSRPARIRRSATHPLGNPAHGQEHTPAEAWIWVGTVPARISQEEFHRVQAKLALNKKQATRNSKGDRYLLRALVSCGACQSACIARTTNGGLRYYICRCQAQPIYSQHDQRCHSRCIPAQQLDALVWEDLCRLITHPGYITDALQRARSGDWLPQHLQARKQALRKAQTGIRQQLDRLTDAYLTAIIPLAEYQRRGADLK